MNRFQLIALDIDGTLLDSRKNLPDACVRAIQEVTDAGKTVAFATGRALSEILEFEPLLPEIRYAVFSSGAGIYDFKEKKMVALTELVSETAATILDSVREKENGCADGDCAGDGRGDSGKGQGKRRYAADCPAQD